jgi:hypothetical protein
MQLTPVLRCVMVVAVVGLVACGGGGKKNGGKTAADTEAPRVVSSVPVDNAAGVDPGTGIVINFSEPIVARTASVVLRVDNVEVASSFTVSGSTLSMQLAHATPAGEASLSLSGIADGAGNVMATRQLRWRYVNALDSTPPSVLRLMPESGAAGIVASTPIRVQFDEALSPVGATVDLRLGSGATVPATVSRVGNDILQIEPGFSGTPTGVATLTVAGVRDQAGNAAAPVTWSWTYAAGPVAGGSLRSDKLANAGIGGNGYADYGCINDALRPAGWHSLFVRAGSAGSGSRIAPYPTIAQAVAAAGASPVVICISTGHYDENVNLGMQRRHMLVGGLNSTFTARDAIAFSTAIRPADADQHVIRAEAPAELVIDGFVVTGSNDRGIAVTAWDTNERVTLRNNHVHHNGCTTPTARTDCGGVDVGGGRTVAVEIANNVIEDNGSGHHGGGVNIGGGTSNLGVLSQVGSANDGFGDVLSMTGQVANVHHNIIRNNRLYETSLPHGAGLSIGMHGDVHHNEFFGNDTWSDGDHYGVGGGLIGQHDRGGTASVALLVVRNNWFEANRAGKAGSAIFLDQFNAGYVYNNVIVRNVGTGAILVDGSCGDTCSGPGGNHGRNFVTLLNNTVADNEGAGLALQDSTAHLYFNVFWRNRSAGASGDIALFDGSPGADNRVRGEHNIIDVNAAAFPLLAESASGDHLANLFRSSQDQDYRLGADSSQLHPYQLHQLFVPAITLPTSVVVAPVEDFDGVSRPDGGGLFNYGAYNR